jgi:hypothetical protein
MYRRIAVPIRFQSPIEKQIRKKGNFPGETRLFIRCVPFYTAA